MKNVFCEFPLQIPLLSRIFFGPYNGRNDLLRTTLVNLTQFNEE